jgi:N-acetylglucosamine-6-phosphate deacetylase
MKEVCDLSLSLSKQDATSELSQSLAGRDPRTGKSIVVRFADGHITAIEEGAPNETAWLAPGLVDLQVNGYCGDDFNADDLTVEAVQRLALRLFYTGITMFQPTIITASEEKIIRNLRVIAAARKMNPWLEHMIPSVHIEGPHIATEAGPRGAHPLEDVRPPDIAEFARWQAASGNLVGMVTVSPHYENACKYISALSRQGILVSLGHSSATPDQIHAGAAAGARLSTHLGNGVANPLPRHPNLIWAQLADDRLTATLIADGHHLPADTVKVILRAKTVSRTILITDLVMLAGMVPGEYETTVGGKVELHADGLLNMAGTNFLAGATATLKDAVAYVVAHTGFSLGDAIRMATECPGRFLRGSSGTLSVGASADLIRFSWREGDSTLTIEDAVVCGRNSDSLSDSINLQV